MAGRYSKTLTTVLLLGLVAALLSPAAVSAQSTFKFKIGVVNFQAVLNTSEAGQRSRKILLASKKQKEVELKSRGDQIKKEKADLGNNILLTEAAKAKKEQELRQREAQWRRDFQEAERDLQKKQMKVSETIFSELKTVINLIADEQKFDFIIEQSNAQTILFSRDKLIDITDQVIQRYNNISK